MSMVAVLPLKDISSAAVGAPAAALSHTDASDTHAITRSGVMPVSRCRRGFESRALSLVVRVVARLPLGWRSSLPHASVSDVRGRRDQWAGQSPLAGEEPEHVRPGD